MCEGGVGLSRGCRQTSRQRSSLCERGARRRFDRLVALGAIRELTGRSTFRLYRLFFGREVSRDTIAGLRGEGFIAAGPRSPTPGAPYAYVTTPGFLARFGFESLRDLPDIEKLEDAGLIGGRGRAGSAATRWRLS